MRGREVRLQWRETPEETWRRDGEGMKKSRRGSEEGDGFTGSRRDVGKRQAGDVASR